MSRCDAFVTCTTMAWSHTLYRTTQLYTTDHLFFSIIILYIDFPLFKYKVYISTDFFLVFLTNCSFCIDIFGLDFFLIIVFTYNLFRISVTMSEKQNDFCFLNE